MSRSTGVAVAALSVLLLAAGTTGTRSQPAVSTGDRVVDAACRDIKNAQTDADLKKVADANQSNSNIALAQAFQRVSSAQEKEKRAKAALEAAKTAADNGHAWLGKVRTNESILAGYRTRQEAARAKLRTILGLETKHRQAQDELDNWKNKIGGDGHDAYVAELEKKARDAKQELDASNIEAAKDELQAANDGYNATPKGNVEDLRRQNARLDEDVTIARALHEGAQKDVTAAQRELSTAQARRKEVARCVAERTAELDPTTGPQLVYLDKHLNRIEGKIGDFEKRAAQMAALCAPILAEIEAIQRDAAALGRDADALAAKAATPQARVSAGYQQRYNKAVQAERDARSAAAAISTAKTHATRAANDACQVSDAIIKNLADPAARARITDVQRSRAEAEQDVTQTAAALDRIRAAHAAVIAANSLQTPLTLEFHGLKTRAGNLKRRRDAIVEKASELGDFNTAITLVVAQLASYNRQATAETKNAPPHAARARATRIAALLDRANKIDRTCVSRVRPTTLTMDAARNGADAKITNAASAIFDKTGVLAEPPNIGPEIERIFNAARTEAETVAAEAVKAVRCEAAARNALANPPACAGAPPPGAVLKPDRPGGLTCKYQCGSSYIEFTVFDGTTTCPPKIEDYTLVGSSKSLPPAAGALVQSGAAWVKKGTTTRSGVQEYSNEFTATTARQAEVDGTVYRRDIQWTFTAPPVSLSPGEEIRIDVSGKVQTTDNGKAVKLPNAPSAGVRVRGLEKVSGELAWANTGEGKNSTYVFRVPADAKGATIELAADWNLGTFAVYAYGDHKKPP